MFKTEGLEIVLILPHKLKKKLIDIHIFDSISIACASMSYRYTVKTALV